MSEPTPSSARDSGEPSAQRGDVLLVLAGALSLMLPSAGLAAAVFVLLGALAWWALPALRRTRQLATFGVLVVAALMLEVALAPGARQAADGEAFRRRVEGRYGKIWQRLDSTAERAAERLASVPGEPGAMLRTFEILSQEAREDPRASPTLLLVDGAGNVVAWAGKGLLHDLVPTGLPARGRLHYASFSAVTLLAVRPLSAQPEPWRVAAGRSLRTDGFPFATSRSYPPPRWSLVPREAVVPGGLLRVALEEGPALVIETSSDAAPAADGWWHRRWRRMALLIWGLGVLTAAWRAQRGGSTSRWWWLAVATGCGLVAGAAIVPWWAGLLWISGGCLLFGVGVKEWQLRGWVAKVTFGLAAFLAAPLIGLGVASVTSRADARVVLWSSPDELMARLGLFAVIWACLGLVAWRRDAAARSGGWRVILPAVLLLAAAAAIDRPVMACGLLALAGLTFAGTWRVGSGSSRRSALLAVGLLAGVAAATGWEIAHRATWKRQLAESILPALAPPSPEELDEMAFDIERFLETSEVQDLAPAGVDDLERRDLAFEVWHHSPLVGPGRLSALRVLPLEGDASTFSFGLPLDDDGRVDWSAANWGVAELPVWGEAVLAGAGEMSLAGEPWARVEYWLVLQPGFRLTADPEEDLVVGLLRAGPRSRAPTVRSLGEVEFGLYDPTGEPMLSPWKNPPRLTADLLAGGRAVLSTPTGSARVFTATGPEGVRALFLPVLSATAALDRVGTHALPAIAVIGLIALALQVPILRRSGLKAAWGHLWNSYSRRLALVYSALLLAPVMLLNLVVVRVLEERLHNEQAAAGESALESAQRVLGEYVLALEPGFGIDAALDDELLAWLAGVVHHDVNLYWKSTVYASSKAELFTAGLLPRRIPGEIYSRLTLLGFGVSTRTNQLGRAEYLELYAPLTVPGVSLQETRLFLSLPLLAQQEETAAQISSLRRRALLGTVSLVALIVALGVNLARRFTSPLTEIVEGTQRIAAGEASLALRPTELELATLVEAIDAMAGRIAEARERLLREKSVVERMVDNITSGVVSLDQSRRVLMANRVAVELIGAEIGEELDRALVRRRRLGPLSDFLRTVGQEGPMQRTATWQAADGSEQEWSLVWVPLPGAGEPSALLVLEDVTEVVRSQRLQAWAEMARMIAHEIKNPLTPIRLSAEHMREVFKTDPAGFAAVFESCTANILLQVGELQQIAGEFSTYSRIPRLEPRPGDVVELVEKIVGGYRDAAPRGIRMQVQAPPEGVRASFDAKLVGRAVRNLIENALRVTPDHGAIEVTVDEVGDKVRIAVADTGPGVRPALLQRIFDPYFSTHDSGTGLGLPIARRIAEEHGGEVTAHNRREGGLEVVIWLPRSSG